jgi:glycosyltransferase involved in cell wall biosynthesis
LRYKGIDLALTALRLVRAEFPDATLTLAGDGDLTPYRRLIAESGDSVQIINRRISDEEAAVIFQSCLCVLAPYTHASASGVIMTAFAYSKAVIVSALPGLLDMVTDGESGLVVPPGDTAALAASMKRLLNDPEEALRLGVGGNAYSVRECSWARIAATHIAEYQRAYDEFPHSHGRGKT